MRRRHERRWNLPTTYHPQYAPPEGDMCTLSVHTLLVNMYPALRLSKRQDYARGNAVATIDPAVAAVCLFDITHPVFLLR
jgi:hypothetical protein